MDDLNLNEIPGYWIAAGVAVAIIVLWIAAGWLWNNRYRALMMKKGKPTPTFNNALGRIFRFLLKEDKEPSAKIKNPFLQKVFVWRNFYFFLAAVSVVLPILGISPLIPLVLLFLTAFVRVRRVFRERNAILSRMFEVANSEFRYKKDAHLNPWGHVNIQKWETLTTPGKTIVMFPPAFRVDNPAKRQEFQQHFDGTVAEDNVWSYEWNGAKGFVECAPVPHLPTMAAYPGSADRPWNEIPLGIGIDGEIVWDITRIPHMLVCGQTGGGKNSLKETPILGKNGWTTVGDLQQGDIIFDENGNESVVTSAHPLEIMEAYEVKLSDGTSMVVGADHLWYTDTQASRASASAQRIMGDSRKRNTLLSDDKRDEISRIIASTASEETISIPQAAELLGVHPTSNFLFDIAKNVGHAEERQEITAYKRPAQEVRQRQHVSVYDASVLKSAMIVSAEKTLAKRNPLFSGPALEELLKWHEEAENNDSLVSKVEVLDRLGLDKKGKQANAVDNAIQKAKNKDSEIRPVIYAGGVVRQRKTTVASAHEVTHMLIHNNDKTANPFITEEFVSRLKSLPETGETDRFTVAEFLNIPAGDIKVWIENTRVKPLRREEKEVVLQTREEIRTHQGVVVKYYPKALYLEKALEHGSQVLYDQRDKLVLGQVRTTLEIMNSLKGNDGRSNHSLPRPKPVQFSERNDLAVAPYTLGAWLGDGASYHATVCGIDHQVRDFIVGDGYAETSAAHQNGKHEDFRIWGFANLLPGLRKLGVLKTQVSDGDTKRIPQEYLMASESQRRALLRGLMDTDGTVDPDGMLSFTTVIPALRDGVVELVRGLGYVARVQTRTPMNTVTQKAGREAYTIAFSANPDDRIFGLDRKNAVHEERYKANPEANRANTRYIVDVVPVGERLMRCISVDSPSRLFLAGDGFIPTHNSVLQRNIIFHIIQHSDRIKFLGVDVKRVELDPYAKYEDTVLGIAKNLEDGVEVMRYARDTMMSRYEMMEQMGVNNFMDLQSPPPALLVMVDEAYMFMAPSGGKTDQQKEEDQLHGEATVIIGEIARLGRAAGVHLVLATQRPDAKVIYGEIKANLGARYLAGRSASTPSLMVLDSDTGTRIPSIRGRGVVSFNGEEEFIQGYFAEQNWIDGWLAEQQNRETGSSLQEITDGSESADSAFSAGSADSAEDEDDIQPDENGVYPKKKREKKKKKEKKSFKRVFKGLTDVPDFDDGQLTYGEPSPVPKKGKGVDTPSESSAGVDVFAEDEDDWSSDGFVDLGEDESSQPVPSFPLDEENEDEGSDIAVFTPPVNAPQATLPLDFEDEEDDEPAFAPVASAVGFGEFADRPVLKGTSSVKQQKEEEWDDEMESIFDDIPHNTPDVAAKKATVPVRPNVTTRAAAAKVPVSPPSTAVAQAQAAQQPAQAQAPTVEKAGKIPARPAKLPSAPSAASPSAAPVSLPPLPSIPKLPPRPKG